MALNILLIIVAYLLGSIPSAVWIGKHFYGIDVREHGSHNAGATNTLRVLGKKAALAVFAIDILKGFAAVMLAHFPATQAAAMPCSTSKLRWSLRPSSATSSQFSPASEAVRVSPHWLGQ